MRLLMTTDTVGGVWTLTKELAIGLLTCGCEVILVSLGRSPSAEQLCDVDGLTLTGKFQYLAQEAPLEWMPENALAYESAESLLLQLCNDFKPDALLLSQYCFGALPVAAPKIVIAHSDVLSWALAVGKAPLADSLWLRTYRTLVQNGLDGVDILVAPTQATLGCMAPHYRLPRRTAVIPNGRTILANAGLRQVCAVTAGRMWDPAKNLALLLNVKSPVPILVAGEVEQVTLEATCTMLGHKSAADLLELFCESAIYICCSLYEPFGLAPLEAALCGCAVVANDIPTLREVWGDAALYFKDAEGLIRLLDRLSHNAHDLAAAQRRSTEHAQRYSVSRMTAAYLEQIEMLCKARSGGEARAA